MRKNLNEWNVVSTSISQQSLAKPNTSKHILLTCDKRKREHLLTESLIWKENCELGSINVDDIFRNDETFDKFIE